MKTKTWKRPGAWIAALALALGAASVTAAPVAAQDDRECRCVDRDGNAIEDCRCFREPRMVWTSWLPTRGARLGVTVESDRNGRDDAQGARIGSVLRDGPADDAGLRRGDIITRLDGHSLLEPLDRDTEDDFDLDRSVPSQRLMAIARDIEPGTEVEVEYLRDGERHTARLEAEDLDRWSDVRVLGSEWDSGAMAERMRELRDRMSDRVHVLETPRGGNAFGYVAPGAGSAVRFGTGENGFSGFVWRSGGYGLELTEMKPGLASYFGVDHGVLVTEVADDSPLGLQAGDVILAIHGRDVETPNQVRRILGSYGEDEEVALRVMRQKRETTIEGRIGR